VGKPPIEFIRRVFMMRRRIFLWMGLGVLFVSLGPSSEALARQTYQVKPGDTLAGICEKLDIPQETLKAANHLRGNKLKTYQTLTIPEAKDKKTAKTSRPPASGQDTYLVKKGDTLARIAKMTGVSLAALRELNPSARSLRVGQTITLRERQRIVQAKASPAETALLKVAPELDEEEGDGGPTDEKAWAEIERHKRESAALLGNWNNPEEPKLLVKFAVGFLGAPYRMGGSSVTGVDCSGFVRKIYQIFNIDLPRTALEQSHMGLPVSRSELSEGDLIFFNTRRNMGHVGIYIGNNEFVHASSRKRGVRIDNLNTPYYDKRFVRAVRLKGTDEGL